MTAIFDNTFYRFPYRPAAFLSNQNIYVSPQESANKSKWKDFVIPNKNE